MRSALALATLIALSAPAAAQYDYRSGNMYNVQPRPGGGAHVQGYNAQTGSMWSTDIDRRGNMNGLDSNMNSWSYDNGSKTYFNYGTGRMCTGEGYARTCF